MIIMKATAGQRLQRFTMQDPHPRLHNRQLKMLGLEYHIQKAKELPHSIYYYGKSASIGKCHTKVLNKSLVLNGTRVCIMFLHCDCV